MDERPRTWVEVELGREGITGRLHDGDLQPRAFSGWLELVSALEDARARQGDQTAVGAASAQPSAPRRKS
jgi:hypothetical protein